MQEQDNETNDFPLEDELDSLKARANQLGITYHPSIGVDKLREKVNAALSSTKTADEEDTDADKATETPSQYRKRMKQEASRLVRIRLTCMNPAKKEYAGEIFSVGNSVVGTFKKYVPFAAEEGWHVPHIMYEMLRDRMCQIFVNGKSKNGVTIRQGKLIKEFAIEVLPDLTAEELQELAQRQAMAQSVG